MKTLFQKLSYLLVGASFVFLYSCGEDEEPIPGPSLQVTAVDGSGATVANGGNLAATDSITFTFTASTPGGFNTLATINGGVRQDITRNDLDIEVGETAPELPLITFYTTAENAGLTAEIDFVIVDEASQTDTVNFTFNITSPPVRSYSATLLEVITGDLLNAAFFSSTTGMTYSPDDVTTTSASISPLIDFGYYYGTADGASLGSPAWFATSEDYSNQVANWGTTNVINFVSTTLTSGQFNETTTWAAIDAAYDAGSDENQVISNLQVGEVFGFQTDANKTGGSKRGLILVKAITGTDGSDGRLEIDVLIQE